MQKFAHVLLFICDNFNIISYSSSNVLGYTCFTHFYLLNLGHICNVSYLMFFTVLSLMSKRFRTISLNNALYKFSISIIIIVLLL